jgi:hypothetical protein
VTELDSLLQTTTKIDDLFFITLKEAVVNLDEISSKSSELYLTIASKVLSKGSEYIDMEFNRLSSMIANPSVMPQAKTLFQLKQNVLRAFNI